MLFSPDWKKYYTPEGAEKDLPGFEFNGIGWYDMEEDTILVLDQIEGTGKYEFWCWNDPNARRKFIDSMSKISFMPVKTNRLTRRGTKNENV